MIVAPASDMSALDEGTDAAVVDVRHAIEGSLRVINSIQHPKGTGDLKLNACVMRRSQCRRLEVCESVDVVSALAMNMTPFHQRAGVTGIGIEHSLEQGVSLVKAIEHTQFTSKFDFEPEAHRIERRSGLERGQSLDAIAEPALAQSRLQ
jgi:hypothetical protein